ncbi:MAG: hypothetical protein J7L53_10320, partial [Deltaproteobacteria bacterium]|nr:hypothetical protein [Deltaproteobacteria bacterium]
MFLFEKQFYLIPETNPLRLIYFHSSFNVVDLLFGYGGVLTRDVIHKIPQKWNRRNLRCRIFQMTVKGFSRQVMGEDILVEEKNGYNEELLVMVIN